MENLRDVVDTRPPFEVVAIADNDQEAVAVAETLEPAIVLVETSERGGGGVETIQRLHELSSNPAVVLLTPHGHNGTAPEYDRGANAYVHKSPDLASIIDVVLAFAVQRRLDG